MTNAKPTAKNLCAKTRPITNPYETWVAGSWTWKVLKKYQTPEKEAANPYARWFCAVQSPFTEPGYDLGDTYVTDVTKNAVRVYVDPAIEPSRSFAVFVQLPGETPATNGVRFATREEAELAGHELLSRWFAPTGFEVRPTTDPVNYEFRDGHAVRLEEGN